MQFLENLKPLKIYKRPMFLPTVDGDKKKKSAIFLLTPNYESSKATMTSDLFINRLRFASYYIEKDLTYFISSKVMNKVDDVTETYIRDFSQYDMYQSLCEMKAAERNALKDSTFGLPKKRKYPLNDESHVRSAIKFFNYVDKDDEAELARNIKKAIKKFGMKVNVGDKNRFSKYYKPVTESADIAIYEGKVVDLGNDNYSYRFYDGDNEVCEVCIRYKEDNNYIYELHVNPQYQKQGIGSSLIEYATDILGGDNLTVDKNNKVALQMYEDAGFEITGTNKQDQYIMSLTEDKLHAKERNALKDSTFGVPSKRKFPLNDESHVRSAIRFFNKVDPEDETTLARNIKKAIKKFGMKVSVGSNNRFSKYYTSHATEAALNEDDEESLEVEEIDHILNLNKELKSWDYGIKKNGKLLNLSGKEFAKEYRLQSPAEFEKTKTGVCWDFCLYQANRMKELRIPYVNYYIELPDTPNSDTHTFTVATVGNKFIYMEASFGKTLGVYSAKKIDDIFNFVLSNMVSNYEGKYSYEIHKFTDYNKYGATTIQFMDDMLKQPLVKKGTIIGGKVIDKGIIKESYISEGYITEFTKYKENFKPKEQLKLSSFKALPLTAIDKKYKEKAPYLKHVDNTGKYNDGKFYVDKDDNVVAVISVNTTVDPVWIQEIQVSKDYQGHGLSKQLLDIAVKQYGAKRLSVNKNNPVAINLYKNYGFKIYDSPDVVHFMALGPVSADESYVSEGYFKDDEDIYYNKDKFDSGEINLCFVLGHMGSGKTSTSNKMADNDTEVYSLDDVQGNEAFDYNNLKEYGDLIYSFFKGPGKKYKVTEENREQVFATYNDDWSGFAKEVNTAFINYAKSYANSHKNKKYIIEGIEIFLFCQPQEFEDYAVYILGTSALKSAIRATKRDIKYAKDNNESKLHALGRKAYDDLTVVRQDEKNINKFRDYFGSLMSANESYIEENCNAIVPDDRITCTGYVNDIQRLKYFCDTSFYETILNSLGYCDIEVRDIPYIHLIEADYDKVEVDNRNGLYFIDIYVNDNGFQSVDEYVTYVTACIIKGLIMSFYPKLPEVIAEDFAKFLSNSLMSRNAENLVDDIIGDHNICDALADLQSKCITEEEWVNKRDNLYDKKLGEALVQEKKAMSAESLTNSLKYRGSTKTKVKLGKLRNTSKHLVDDIKDSMEIEGPKAPKLPTAPKTPSATSSKNNNSSEEDNNENSEEKITESMLRALSEENYIIYGDYVTFFNEDAANDTMLKRILWTERMVKRKEVVALLDRVKADCPFIKYTYTDLKRYQQRNLFVDLYYYNQAFFKNNTWKLRKAFNLYKDLLDRLINDKRIKQAGYTRRTVFIPINDWHKNPSTRMWLFREDINPISIIYDLMVNDPNGLKKLFKGVGVVFFSKDVYFTVDMQNCTKRDAMKFKTFIQKINKGEEFEAEDIDTTEDTPSKEAIKTTIMDDIEDSKGVDLTKANDKVKKDKSTDKITTTVTPTVKTSTTKNSSSKAKSTTTSTSTPKTASRSNSTTAARVKRAKKQAEEDVKQKDEEVKEVEKNMSKATANKPETDSKIKSDEELQKEIIRSIDADLIDNPDIQDVDTAYDAMDSDEDLKDLLVGLDSMKDDTVNISQARAERMSELDRELLDKSVKGRTIKEIIKPAEDPTKPVPLPETSLPVASPNPEWKDMTYMNFDKTYDLEKDIINSFEHFTTTTRPMAIRNITAVDNSTSEDYIDVYTCEYEDYRGKRYTIKLDIPKVKNERFILRGNTRMLQTQFFNMPIVKTADDVCQIVTNYKKIIISRYNTATGKSLPVTSRLIKAADKYKGNRIKFYPGDNTLICAKYNLPIDYIDLSAVFSKIETDAWTIYFNQDELRKEYEVDDKLGTPYAVSKDKKNLKYYSNSDTRPFIYELLALIEHTKDNSFDTDFSELIDSIAPTSKGTYTRAKIMGSEIPLVVVCAYHDGLTNVLKKANIRYQLKDKLTPEERHGTEFDYIRFKDGYLVFVSDYNSSLLLNGLKDCDCNLYSMMDIDDKNMYLDFLDNFGGRIKADGLDNFYDCEIDPISKETLAYYKLPTEYISVLLYANRLLSDNKFVKHTDTSSRRARRFELIAAYTYQVLADAYSDYSTSVKHNRNGATFSCKQSAVIDKILQDPTSSDYSTINMLNDIESTNAITTKGLSGLNADRSYSLDKRTYDDSMLDVVGMSTGFSANVGITRQATMDMNIEGERGYVKDIHGNTKDMNTAKTLTATEAVVPLSTTHDDPFRVAMTFIQSSKHAVRTDHSDPLLVTNGADEALPYLCSDQFAHKAKQDGTITELTDEDMIVEYKDGSKEYIDLKETIQKNSDGGFYVPLKLDADEKLKVGSKVKPNQILAYDKTSLSNSAGEDDNLAYDVGTLAKVAIINMDEGFEDSGIVTEGLAKKLTARIIYMEDCILDKSTNIYNLAKVGQHVEQGDSLLVWQTPYDEEEVNALLKALANDREAVSELGRHTVRSEVTGTLVGIKMYRTVELDELSDSLKKALRDYEKPIGELKKKLKEENIDTSTLPANYPLKATGKLKKAGDGVLIEFYVEYDDIVGVGDKITYNAANKAVIKSVIPEGKEPYTDFRPNEPISALVSSTSIAKRMVTSTRVYGYLQKLMIELDRSCKDMAGIPYDDSTV